MKNQQLLVSVVMPVYNAGKFLVASLQSILNQGYKNFELIAVDDASEDNSWKILQDFSQKDSRVRIFKNVKNAGVSHNLKRGIKYARGQLIAFMDSDDISFPYRLEKQVNYLKKHPKTVAVGGQCILINKNGEVIGEKRFPESFHDIYNYIFKFDPVQQPTLMIKRKLLPKNFEYFGDGMDLSEELGLNFKLFNYGKVENLPDDTLMYRLHDTNLHLRNVKKTFIQTLHARIKAVIRYKYRPTFSGVIVTFFQIFVVMLLPQRLTLFIYKKMRNISIETKEISYSPSLNNSAKNVLSLN